MLLARLFNRDSSTFACQTKHAHCVFALFFQQKFFLGAFCFEGAFFCALCFLKFFKRFWFCLRFVCAFCLCVLFFLLVVTCFSVL